MNLEDMIHARLEGDPAIAGELALYAGRPAIATTEFPSDQQEGWGGRAQYPRILFRYERIADKKRAAAGTLRVAVYTLTSGFEASERLENAVRARLEGVVMQPPGGTPFCASWMQTTPYEIDTGGHLVILKEVSFDILEFPPQVTATPDPVLSMNRFIRASTDGVFLVGYDPLDGGVYEPSREKPAVYVRAASFGKDHESYALVWATTQLVLHILAPSADDRTQWARAFYNVLFRLGEVMMEDGHPMFIQDITANNGADYLREGQLTVKCLFTMLSARMDREYGKDPLNHVFVDVEHEGD